MTNRLRNALGLVCAGFDALIDVWTQRKLGLAALDPRHPPHRTPGSSDAGVNDDCVMASRHDLIGTNINQLLTAGHRSL